MDHSLLIRWLVEILRESSARLMVLREKEGEGARGRAAVCGALFRDVQRMAYGRSDDGFLCMVLPASGDRRYRRSSRSVQVKWSQP